jgi:hypothetical protein
MAKYALCIGINDYPGFGSDLQGCVNDAQDWGNELQARGFQVTALLDAAATKAAIVREMSKIVETAQAQDSVVITYSGHGTWVPDESGDESDQRDEALCPYDINSGAILGDDELFEIFSRRSSRAKVVFLSDSCHSGTVSRLGKPLSEDGARRRVRFLPPELFLSAELKARALTVAGRPAASKSRGSVLLISGCKDTEYSYDAFFDGRPNGAFTRVALAALKAAKKEATYLEWFRAIRNALPSVDYAQTPQLTATRTQKKWPALG